MASEDKVIPLYEGFAEILRDSGADTRQQQVAMQKIEILLRPYKIELKKPGQGAKE